MRHPGQLKTIQTLIQGRGSRLETLRFEAEIQLNRTQLVLEALPQTLGESVSVGQLRDGLLTLYVPKAAVASQLRFEEPNLVRVLSAHPLFFGIRRIQCRVRPAPVLPTPAPAQQHPHSDIAETALHQIAQLFASSSLRPHDPAMDGQGLDSPQHGRRSPRHSDADRKTTVATVDCSTHDHCDGQHNDR